MTNFCVNLGDAFLLETPPNGMHLYIAIALIDEDSDTYLFVNITSLRPNSDTSCILKPGAGVPKFILYDSAVAYEACA
ncbi:hypothetical protein [Scytonema sp. NUACC26]|uniref:hypothetical protein n=1 Tax=Scytonema sp. NUACC26 TaxID=3140176 RepID=UPI0034DBF289